jgi:predicted nucleotidyltransferase
MAGALPIRVPRSELAELCRRHHIARLSLFGSVLREDFGPSSDIDVLVEVESPGLDSRARSAGRLHHRKGLEPSSDPGDGSISSNASG